MAGLENGLGKPQRLKLFYGLLASVGRLRQVVRYQHDLAEHSRQAINSYLAEDLSWFDGVHHQEKLIWWAALKCRALCCLGWLSPAGLVGESLFANVRFWRKEYGAAARHYHRAIFQVRRHMRLARHPKAHPARKAGYRYYEKIGAILETNLARSYIFENNFRRAEAVLRDATDLFPNSVDLHECWALFATAKPEPDWEFAKRAYERAYAADPANNAAVRHSSNLGVLCRRKHEAALKGERYADAERELMESIEHFSRAGENEWIGRGCFELGDLAKRQDKLAIAAGYFARGSKHYRDAGNFDSASYLAELAGDVFFQQDELTSAAEAYDCAAELAEKIPDRAAGDRLRIPLLLSAGFLRVILSQWPAARRDIGTAAALAETLDGSNAYLATIRDDVLELFTTEERRKTLRQFFERGLEETEDSSLKRRLHEGLLTMYSWSGVEIAVDAYRDDAIDAMRQSQFFTPIFIVIDASLIPSGDQGPLKQLLNGMRDRIRSRFGLAVPEIPLGVEQSRTDGAGYVLYVRGVSPVFQKLDLNRRLFVGDQAILAKRGIRGIGARDPQEQELAFWVQSADCPADLNAWEVLEYPVRQLEGLVTARLDLFLGVDEVSQMLTATSAGVAETIRKDSDLLSGLTTVAKSLLRERVPVDQFGLIVSEFLRLRRASAPSFQIVAELRCLSQLRAHLWGNCGRYSLIPLGQRLEQYLLSNLRLQDRASSLLLDLPALSKVLATIDKQLPDPHRKGIVVRHRLLRPLVRKLIARKFPEVPILALDELVPGVAIESPF